MDGQMTNGTGAADTYNGMVNSSLYNGEATMVIEKDGLTISSLFSDFTAGYEEILSVKSGDYTVEIVTRDDTICCSRMGNSGDWFHNRLLQAYNSAVTSALLVKGGCLFETRGNMAYENFRRSGTIRVFEDCICLLPPFLEARRLPFSFLCCMKKENYALHLRFTTGEVCVLSMLGRDLDPLEKCIMECVMKLRKNNAAWIGELCGELNASQQTKAANLLPGKIAVPMQKLAALPPLKDAVLAKVGGSDMKAAWPVLTELCDGDRIAVGIWRLPDEEVERLKQKMMEDLSERAEGAAGTSGDGTGADAVTELTPEQEEALKWMIWAAVPSKDGRTAVVESAFPNEATATYVYSIPGAWEEFLMILNRTMEAVDFNREVIMLPEEKIYDGGHVPEQMLVSRTPALGMLRKQFSGRVIHKSDEGWKNSLKRYLEQEA